MKTFNSIFIVCELFLWMKRNVHTTIIVYFCSLILQFLCSFQFFHFDQQSSAATLLTNWKQHTLSVSKQRGQFLPPPSPPLPLPNPPTGVENILKVVYFQLSPRYPISFVQASVFIFAWNVDEWLSVHSVAGNLGWLCSSTASHDPTTCGKLHWVNPSSCDKLLFCIHWQHFQELKGKNVWNKKQWWI